MKHRLVLLFSQWRDVGALLRVRALNQWCAPGGACVSSWVAELVLFAPSWRVHKTLLEVPMSGS